MSSPAKDPGLARVLRPVAPPRTFERLFGPDEEARLLGCIRRSGPYRPISAQYSVDTDEAKTAAAGEARVAPTFHAPFALDGVCFHPEIEDIFLSPRLLALARGYWGADCARPERLFVNINGPTINRDPGHLDVPSFRGAGRHNMPMWALALMGRSGLFRPWLIKMAQVITWWWKGTEGGGFTYWPDGPLGPPERVAPPIWNRSILVQNELMYHRAEGNGPPARREPPGVTRDSVLAVDPDDPEGWLVKTGERVLDRVAGDELRIMLHWNAEIFHDRADLKRTMDHTDDLTPERVFEMFCADMRARGVRFEVPTDPKHDRAFMATLGETYDLGPPSLYPEAAPREAA
jgi:hypothetical protein